MAAYPETRYHLLYHVIPLANRQNLNFCKQIEIGGMGYSETAYYLVGRIKKK